MTTEDINSNHAQENVTFMLDHHSTIIKEKLERIYAVASKTRRAEESLDEDKRDVNMIAILGLIEDLSSDFQSVYEIERLLKALPNQSWRA